jgi:hypothetical protein
MSRSFQIVDLIKVSKFHIDSLSYAHGGDEHLCCSGPVSSVLHHGLLDLLNCPFFVWSSYWLGLVQLLFPPLAWWMVIWCGGFTILLCVYCFDFVWYLCHHCESCLLRMLLDGRPMWNIMWHYDWRRNVTLWLKKTAIAWGQLDKYMSAAMDAHTTIEELLEAVFSMRSMLRPYNEDTGQLVS